MRTLVVCLIAASLIASPARAGSEGNKDAAAAAKTEAKNAAASKSKASEPAKDASAGTQPGSPIEIELQQLKNELEAQRALLQAQQDRMAALEEELREVHANTAAPASAATSGAPADPTTAAKEPGVAQDQEGLAKRVENVENKIKDFGPFRFSGDFRLRDEPFFGGPTNESQVRNRERYRLRFNVNAKLNESVSGGFSIASGDINDPISTNQTTTQFYTRKPFFIDKAFINYNPGYFKPLTLTGGKFAYNWYNTEMTWDKDLNPEGLGQTLGFDINTLVLKRFALVGFELPFAEVAGVSLNDKSIVQSAVYGGQVQTIWQFTSHVKFGAYSGFYNYHDADPIAFALATASLKNPQTPLVGALPLGGNSVQNSITTTTQTSVVTVNGTAISTGIKTITNAQFASKFGLFDSIARFDIDTNAARWPIIVQGDFVQNTEACANVGNILSAPKTTSTATFSESTNAPCNPHARRGYWLEARFGRTTFPGQVVEKGDWDFAYTRLFIEREAVMGAFNFSDIRQPSNVSQHRVEVFYQAYKNVQLAWTGLFGRPLVSASSPAPAEPLLKRLQFDIVYRF